MLHSLDNIGGGTPRKRLVKAALGDVYTFLATALISAACTSCSPNGKDGSTDSEEVSVTSEEPSSTDENMIGMTESEREEPASKYNGRYSVYEYNFRGRGKAHSEDEIRKYDLCGSSSYGSDVSAEVHIEWPEAQSGLSKDALAKVRKSILWMAFASEAPTEWKTQETPVRYILPEALGENDATLESRIKKLDAEWKDGEFGLSVRDWGLLTEDALSLQTGRLPATDDGRITDDTLRLALSGIKKCANEKYVCNPAAEGCHFCSRWTFAADVHLDWPFGMEPKNGAKWYERPVVCVWNNGYSNDGGNGCHAQFSSKVYSLPDGREVNVDDYFAADKKQELYDYVWRRLLADNKVEKEDIEDERGIDLMGGEVSMRVTKEGVEWCLSPYSHFPGCYGTSPVFIKWEDLAKFRQ